MEYQGKIRLLLHATLLALAVSAFAKPAPAQSPPNGSGLKDTVSTTPIDLASALKLAGVENREILIARQHVIEAVALRQLAAAQFLPTLNGGGNYDAHTGNVQQADGNILNVNRNALYVGAGANAVAGGTVNIPGVVYNVNVSQTIFNCLSSRQQVVRRRFSEIATQNEMLRRVAMAYLDLLRTEGLRGLTVQAQGEAAEIARLTDDYAKVKEGRQADADRALTERENRDIDRIDADAKVRMAGARLAEWLNLSPAVHLRPVEEKLVPMPLVPDNIPLSELLAIALLQRPELGARRAAIRQALLELDGAKALPFSPNLISGFSSGTFGGGSNLAPPGFGSFDNRNDVDVVLYWTVRNLGLGNVALIRLTASQWRSAQLEQIEVLNQVRSEVAQAHARIQVQYARMLVSEKAVPVGVRTLKEEMQRIKGFVGLPIELLESFRLLNQARVEYLEAIAAYNQAQFDLYVALGQPPADALARPAGTRE